MNVSRCSFGLKVTVFNCIASLLVLGAGCKKAPPPGPETAQPPPPPSVPEPGTNASLQAELDSLREIPFVHAPVDRPLAVSKPAPTARDWAANALRAGYLQSGFTNARWDSQAFEAFEAYADYSRKLQDERLDSITNAVVRARAAGCEDPMIRYMQARYCPNDQNDTEENYARALVRVFRSLWTSKHHPAFKYVVGHKAMVAARDAAPKGARGALVLLVNASLEDFARDSNAPPAEVFQAAFDWEGFARSTNWQHLVMCDLDGILETNWRKDPRLYCLRGTAEVHEAWNSRGGGWATKVTDAGWQGFREHLNKAAELLTKSWEMGPTNAFTAYQMMQVELGQGRGRSTMQRWFERAMALSTNYYDAVQLMSFYLEPRYYGSAEEALAFARSCVTNKNWGGRVPLVLPYLHHSLARYNDKAESPDYWHQPEVWKDLRLAYERFFELNPSETGWRHDYARDAWLCGQYQAFLAQTKLFSGGTNFGFFGGRAKFEEMLREATASGPGSK